MEPTSETATSQGQDTSKLVHRAIKGDVDAYGELYRIHLDRIYRYVFYLVGNTMMAEDITEEVFIKAWKQ
jgi:RNA polymerase sigma-70 factor (ECF subfamily)